MKINGKSITGDITFDPDHGTLTLHGSLAELNLHAGKNKIIVLRKGAHSNAIKFKLQ